MAGTGFGYLRPRVVVELAGQPNTKPVQYVKICSLYGAGFYYIPGTDTCIKVGGWVRMQMGNGYQGSMTTGPMVGNDNNRWENDFMTRNRGYITADARSQTEYGTLRAYIAVGLSNDNPNGSTNNGAGFSANRAFIQIAGWTAGRAQSFYDFMNYAAVSYHGGAIWSPGGADTGDGGQQVLAYTAQFGNGLSATLSAEDQRNGAVPLYNGGAGGGAVAVAAWNGARGNKMPDFVGNLRVDQAWGSAQIAGALHNASANYYDVLLAGHPSDVWGYAVSAGLRINAPMIGKGDYFQTQVNWTKGAIRYATFGSSFFRREGAESGFGLVTDGVYGTTGDIELTTAWTVAASYEHNWNPHWKTSLYGGYTDVSYSDRANALVCGTVLLATGCDQDFATWQIGSRTAWAPVQNLEVGLDIMYTHLDSGNSGAVLTSADQDAWVTYLRIQRNFYP
jgi:hypothetical protein